MNRDIHRRMLAMSAVAVITAASVRAADIRRLTLTEAVHLAISQNRTLKIARLKVNENEHRKAGEHSEYFPRVTNQSNALHVTELQIIELPAGTFGTVAGTPIPTRGVVVPQGKLTFFSSGTMIAQPLTQLIRIHQANRMAAAEVALRVPEPVGVIDAHPVEQAGREPPKDQVMRVGEDPLVLGPEPDERIDVEEAPIPELLPRGAPEG